MKTVPPDVHPVNIARRLNAAMEQMIAVRGAPSEARFDIELNCIVARYPTGPVAVHPIPLSVPNV